MYLLDFQCGAPRLRDSNSYFPLNAFKYVNNFSESFRESRENRLEFVNLYQIGLVLKFSIILQNIHWSDEQLAGLGQEAFADRAAKQNDKVRSDLEVTP